jgi:hypothetical protein
MFVEAWLTLGLLVVMFAVLGGDEFPTWLVAQKDGGSLGRLARRSAGFWNSAMSPQPTLEPMRAPALHND